MEWIQSNVFFVMQSGFLIDGVTPIRDLRSLVSDHVDELDQEELDQMAEKIYQDLLDEIIFGLGIEVHRSGTRGH